MDIHQHAKTTPKGRLLMVQRLAEGWTVARVAAAFGVSARTVRKWQVRYAGEGLVGLRDRSSRPHVGPTRLDQAVEAEILALRRERLSGPAIAHRLRRPASTVGLVLRRHGLGRLAALEPRPEVVRYQRQRPGELIQLDIKKLGRIAGVGHRITGDRRSRARGVGWDFLHVAIDDASRLAYSELLPDERKARRAQGKCGDLSRPRAGLVHGSRRQGRAGDDRQRLGLCQPCLPPGGPGRRPQAQAEPRRVCRRLVGLSQAARGRLLA